MSLSPNIFSPPCLCQRVTTDFPPSALTDSLCGGCGHSMWVTLRPSLFSELALILQSSTSHRRSPSRLQYPAAKPLGLKIELINTFSKYKWDDCLLMDCLSFGSISFQGECLVMTRERETNIIMCCQSLLWKWAWWRGSLSHPHSAWFSLQTPTCALWLCEFANKTRLCIYTHVTKLTQKSQTRQTQCKHSSI